MNYALEFYNVSKRYLLGSGRRSMREALAGLQRKVRGSSKDQRNELWALKDVSFQIRPGEAVGIIGPNGAGKTTTLKLATFVTKPTSGDLVVHGRTSALIELGAGFHPDLTGRENIFLNGTILGLKRHEIEQRFDEIVAFSELERFIDTPVKRYSSGMYARLGFSVAAHVKPDILIVDEVLAVGDTAFQSKCLSHMGQMKKAGTTIILVSHTLPRLRRLCDRAILLHKGKVIADGNVDEVIDLYHTNPEYSSNLRETAELRIEAPQKPQEQGRLVSITQVTFLDKNEQRVQTYQVGDRLLARIFYKASQRIDHPVFEIWFHLADGTDYASHTTDWDQFLCNYIEGEGYIDLIVDPLCFMPGRYSFSAAITAEDGISRFDWHFQRYWIDVQANTYAHGLIYLPHQWEHRNGSPAPVQQDLEFTKS